MFGAGLMLLVGTGGTLRVAGGGVRLVTGTVTGETVADDLEDVHAAETLGGGRRQRGHGTLVSRWETHW